MAEHSTSLDQDKYITQLALWKKRESLSVWYDYAGKKISYKFLFFVAVQLDHQHAISLAYKWPECKVTRS